MAGRSRGKPFGLKKPPLYITVKTFLDRYPDGQIFKELIQNADDAGATVVRFYLDPRQHKEDDLVDPAMARFQGPALLAYNDAQFTDQDWEGIQKPQCSNKAEDPLKVGKFGIGFNSIYHITDLPTILCGEMMGILDPQEEVWEGESGRAYTFSDICKFRGTVAAYDTICDFSKPFVGTLFRFPLRTKKSKLSQKCHTVSSLRELFDAFKKEAHCLPLFLRSVANVEIYELPDTSKVQFQVSMVSSDHKEHQTFVKGVSAMFNSHTRQAVPLILNCGNEYSIQVKVADHMPMCYKWLVFEQAGSEDLEVLDVANQLHLLPWVGVAFEVGKRDVGLGGRVFCCLPMPEEISSPLPVHVNGTFGLSDDRRTLKWTCSERQNDVVSRWNEIIVNKLLPSCYARLIHFCTCRYNLSARDVYKAWPDIALVKENANWSPILEPFFEYLMVLNVLWTDNSALSNSEHWLTVSDAVIVPNDAEISTCVLATIQKVMLRCGSNLVQVPNNVLRGLEYSKCTVTKLSADLMCTKLKKYPQHYTNECRDDKLNLLSYCLSDGSYTKVIGLELLPLINGSFVMFENSCFRLKVFLCTTNYPCQLFNLFKKVDNSLVEESLDKKLLDIAMSEITQLKLLDDALVAYLLCKCLPSPNLHYLQEQYLPTGWLKSFWEWAVSHDLDAFSGLFLVPLSHPSGCISKLTKIDKSTVVLVEDGNENEESLQCIKKLQLRVIVGQDYPYVCHKKLFSFVHKVSPAGLLKALQNLDKTSLGSIKLNETEACTLQGLLANFKINSGHLDVVIEIPILISSKSSIISLQYGKKNSWRSKIIVCPEEFPYSCLPSTLVVLSSTKNIIPFLHQLTEYQYLDFPNPSELIKDIIIPIVADKAASNDEIENMMKQVLNYVTKTSIEICSEISNLPFIRVNGMTDLKSPSELYDPSVPELCNLFLNQPVFPLPPFNQDPYILKLRWCGLKRRVNLIEVVNIINEISPPRSLTCLPQAVDLVRMQRSCAVLNHISNNTRNFQQDFNKLLVARSLLPIQCSVPDGYPKCLKWLGSNYTSHVISLSDSVVLMKSDVIPYIAGSQVYIVRQQYALSPEKLRELSCVSTCSPKHVLAHFKEVIDHYKEMEEDILRTIIHHVYTFLMDHYLECDDLFTFSHPWIWTGDTFVHPQIVAMKKNRVLQHNYEPYHYIVPNELQKYEKLFTRFDVPLVTTDLQLVSVMAGMKETCKLDMPDALEMIIGILNHLTSGGVKMVDLPGAIIYVPIESGSLRLEDSRDVVYCDNECIRHYMARLKTEENDKIIHNKIGSKLAKCLNVSPISTSISKQLYTFKNISQHEPLVVRLKNILRDYKDGLTIIKELIQNADDAGATVVNICYDARTHNIDPNKLVFPGMASSHGPALVVHNDAQFTEADLINITKLAGATKMDEPLKIGKFGLGFCSVYHITDVPSFISGDSFNVFDPTGKHLSLSEGDADQPRGQRIDLAHPILTSSLQLGPYVGLYGFSNQYVYNETLFRFPFRVAPSEISDTLYSEVTINTLKSDIYETGSKLLIFLQNVVKITFSVISRDKSEPSMVIELQKTEGSIRCDSCKRCTIKSFQFQFPVINIRNDNWLISKCSDQIDHLGVKKNAVASVACLLQGEVDEKHSGIALPDGRCSLRAFDGESFCYLPLSCQTGLPVHVSSNFAVVNNRRGLWTADCSDSCQGESEVQWNIALMQGVIARAYLCLLKALKVLSDNYLKGYQFYSVWPLTRNLKQQVPWSMCIQALYKDIASCELLYSVFARNWFKIQSCTFLSPKILLQSHESSFCAAEVEDVMKELKLPVVMLPLEYQSEITKLHLILLFTEKDFIDVLYHKMNNISLHSRVAVLKKVFKIYSHSKGDKDRCSLLKQKLLTKPSVPCISDGGQLRMCSEVVDPRAVFATLFDLEEKLFPIDEFCKDDIIYSTLKELGMISHILPWTMIEERMKLIPEVYKRNRIKALQRVKIIVQCVHENIKFGDMPDAMMKSKLSSIPCFPTQKRPAYFPIKWLGTGELRCSREMVIPSDRSIDFGCIAGSEAYIVCTDSPSSGGCGGIPKKVLEVFGFCLKPSIAEVLRQLKCLIDLLKPQSSILNKSIAQISSSTSNCLMTVNYEFITKICSVLYTYFETYAAFDCLQSKLCELRTIPCIWSGETFVYPSFIAEQWSLNGPFLYRIPKELATTSKLKKFLEIKHKFSAQDILDALNKISLTYGTKPVDKDCHDVLRLAISELTKEEVLPEGDVMMPSDTFVMHKARDLYYQDDECWPIDNRCTMINGLVPNELARRLGVKPVRNRKLEQCASQFGASPFGQREKLTQRIRNILREYPFDITVLKELLQNADDAKATKMFVILDCRNHGNKKVPSDEWKKLQGPALLVWNDSTFSDRDIEGIQKLGLGSKRSDAETIGQYGIGFNVVYHLTDCPSFITNNALYVFDPHCRYIPQAEPQNPGCKYDLDKGFLENFGDLKSPYLYTSLNCNENFHSGSLFRFPLRHTHQLVRESEIAASDNRLLAEQQKPVTVLMIKEMIRDWAPKIKQCLYFLHSIMEIKFCFIESAQPSSLITLHHYKCNLSITANEKRGTMYSAIRHFDSFNRLPSSVSYPLEIVEFDGSGREVCREQWIIQQGIGDLLNEHQTWEFIDSLKPRHGIAAPLNGSTQCKGQVFCFLPLPILSGLPVHINGQFILDTSRRALWTSTNPDQQDMRMRWNDNMFKSIASSYATFLIELPSVANIIEIYYGLFPKWTAGSDTMMEGSWLHIAINVYKTLAQLNAPILCRHADSGANATWHPLHASKKCDQMYFEADDAIECKLIKIIEALHINITRAPLFIKDHFMEVGVDIPNIGPDTVYTHYTCCYTKLLQIPIDLTKTAFKSISNFKLFSKYVLKSKTGTGTFTFLDSPFGNALLVTADSKLRVFDHFNKVLVSKYSHLFPHHSHMFLHPNLMEIQYSKDYFKTPEECTVECINDMIGSILPKKLSNTHHVQPASNYITHDMLIYVWHCLSEDLVFNSKLDHIIRQWALLLTTDNELFSYSDNYVVPFVLDEKRHADGKVPEIVDVLVTLGMPILNTDVVGRCVTPCPHTSEHSKMLRNLLHFHNESDISSHLNDEMVDCLLKYFQNINFHVNPNDCHFLLQLPLCMDVTNLFRIPSNTKVCMWPDNFPNTGISKWIHNSDVIFVQRRWKWTTFHSLVLVINEISPADVYLNYVFKYFSHLTEDERYEHLMYIRDNICQLPSKFKESLQALPCIEHDGTVKCISDFCDPYKKIFTFFGMHFKALPPRYHHPTWIHFFSLLGLRTAPTTKEFIDFCTLIASGRVPDTPQVSQQLLECLFEEEAWHNDSGFLSQVRTIPFVCTEPVPEVSWIANSYQSPSIKQGNVTVCMTQLSGSATKKHMEILWTVRPIVKFPKDAMKKQKMLQSLHVIIHPAISDVVKNVENISKSRFTNSALFRNYPPSFQMPVGHKSLINVMVEIFKYLKDSDGSHGLGELPCIPVHANPDQTNFNGFVLVKPKQVMLDESASHFHPYLHTLPDELSQFIQYLYTLGVAKIVGLSHIRLALELISEHESCLDLSSAHIDLNTNNLIIKLVDKLYSLLKQSDEVIADQLKPLYLPSSIGKLGKSSDLFYQDHGVYGNLQVIGKYATFIRLPVVCHFTHIELINLLPSDIRPKPLSKHCIERLHSQSAIIQQRSIAADKLHSVLKSALFRDAVCAIVKHDTSNEASSKVEAYLKDFQNHVEVYEVNPLHVELLLASDTKNAIASMSMPIYFYVNGTSCIIYLKAKVSSYELHNLHNEIAIKLTGVICGGVELKVGYLSEHIAVLVKAENIEEVKDYLMRLGIKLDSATCKQDSDLTPVLGARIPSTWFQHLDHNVDNIYRPEEWVVYEEEEGVMILVRILCPILHDLEEDRHLPRRYVVWISNDETKEVSYLDLYKISRTTPAQQMLSADIVAAKREDDGHARKRPRLDHLEYGKNELLAELKTYWRLNKEDQKKALRRIYLKWHPDKNHDQADFAEEIFKFLKEQLELHDQESSNADVEHNYTSSSNCWQPSWDSYARSHYGSAQGTNYTSAQFTSHFNFSCPSPSGNRSEAKRWLSQAEGDFEALVILYNEVATHPDVCCNVCFMAHEVAEKALKAGRYATTGMSSDNLKHHQLVHHAYAIMSERPEVSQGLSSLVTPLEPYYLDTRFPNRHGGSIVPKSLYHSHDALDAKEKAANILQIIRNIIGN